MAVLSLYPADMEYINEKTGKVTGVTSTSMCDSDFEETDDSVNPIRYLRHGTQDTVEGSDKPMIHPFWGAGFSFARGHFVVNVPYDQYLPMVFQGEEINIGIRGFTYGYDYYRPAHHLCFHRYSTKDKRSTYLYWADNDKKYKGAQKEGYKRLVSIIEMPP